MIKDYIYKIITDKHKKGVIVSVIRTILFLLSLLYGLSVALTKFLYKSGILRVTQVGCKVISIGNITWGGTGKTPLVELVASRLKKEGRRVAILSRGYKSDDEPNILALRLPGIPILIGRDRIKNAKEARQKHGVDTIILDDGFQHWRLFRDLDIVAIDAINAFGNGNLIPAGILREPADALRRADILVLTKTDLVYDIEGLKSLLKKISPKSTVFQSIHEIVSLVKTDGQTVNSSDLQARPVLVLSGIAEPASFEKMVNNMGINIGLRLKFPDHHNYTEEDIEKIKQDCRINNIATIITTEKDAIKLKDRIDYLVLKIKIRIIQDEAFFKRISAIY